MSKIQAAKEATQALEQAFQKYTTTAQKLSEAERHETQCRTAYESAVAEYDGDDRAQRKVRETSDELAMARAMVARLNRAAKTSAVDLITPTRLAREAVGEALREARENDETELIAAVRPFFGDERQAEKAVKTMPPTRRAHALRGGPGSIFIRDDRIELLAEAILAQCKNSLRALSGE